MAKEKNWLIRTTNYQILGPVSKEKIVEFVNKGSLKGEDEITSGNGYWFLIKEKELLEKYVFGEIPQTFNPITEAPNVITANKTDQTGTHNKIPSAIPVAQKTTDADGETNLPDAGDLEYPDMNLPASDDLEYPDMDMSAPSGELNIDELDTSPAPAAAPSGSSPGPAVEVSPEDELEGLLPDDSDLEYPDMMGAPDDDYKVDLEDFDEDTAPTNPHIEDFEEETDPGINPIQEEEPEELAEEPAEEVVEIPKPAKRPVLKKAATPIAKKTAKVSKSAKPKKPQRNDRLLFLLTSIFFITFLLAAVVFYYKKVLNKPLPFIGTTIINTIIPSASAQTGQTESLVKKKLFLASKKFKKII